MRTARAAEAARAFFLPFRFLCPALKHASLAPGQGAGYNKGKPAGPNDESEECLMMPTTLQIGANIAARRRARGLTQEQLAASLGVSAPAVSKWETDSSYPDITLLCPLARALRCRVDELLQFAPAMTEAEAAEHLDSVVHLALSGDRTGAEQALTALVQEYPGCAVLQYHAAVGWSALQILFPQADEADRQRWQARALALWEELHSGSDAAMAQYAANQLASHAVLHGELDRAEALLAELPQQIVDPTMTRYQLQLKQGDPDAARATLQKRLFALVQQAAGVLASLPTVLPETQRQLAAAEAYHTLAAAFGLLDSSALLKVEPLLKEGRVPQAAAALEAYVDVLTGPVPTPDPALFAPTLPAKSAAAADKDPDLRALRQVLQRQLAADPAFAPLLDDPRARAALERLAQ